jgi:hypothetical protein
VYKKPIYLHELLCLNDNHKTKIEKIVLKTLDYQIKCSKSQNETEIYFTYFILCEIFNKIKHHINYLNVCINHINKDAQDLYHRNLIFIRFNPDNYVDSTGTKIPSCWSTNKKNKAKTILH